MQRKYTNGKQLEFGFSMGALDEAEENIAHYRSRLQIGAEPETRAALLRLLLAEEKMLGRTREQLSRIDRHIEKLQRIIAEQEKRIGRVNFAGIGSERATLLLSTLNEPHGDISESSPMDYR